MSDDDILAIVAALEFVASREEAPSQTSRWKMSGRQYAGTRNTLTAGTLAGHVLCPPALASSSLSPSMAPRRIQTPRDERVPYPGVTSRWKNS